MSYRSYFFDREDLELTEFASSYEEAISCITHEHLLLLPHISFIMLKPDAYIRGVIPNILETLIGHGIFPVRYQLLQLTEESIDNLYMFVKLKYASSWWIMKKVYTFAPCLPTIVMGEPGEYCHLSARIRSIVGPTTPIMGAEKQLRYQFRATHRILNLIHATDDPAAAYRESRVFFSADELSNVLKEASGHIPTEQYNNRWIADLDLKPKSPINLSYTYIKWKLKSMLITRIIAACSNGLEARFGCEQYLEAISSILESEHELALKNMPLREEWFQTRGILDLERVVLHQFNERLTAVNAIESRRKYASEGREKRMKSIAEIKMCLEIWQALLSDVDFTTSNLEALLGNMHSLDLVLSEYDEVVLHSAWSGVSTELKDWVTNYPLFLSRYL